MSISELDATGANILTSLAWWLHGTFVAVDDQNCALANQRNVLPYHPVVVQQSWSEIFPTAPQPIVRSVGVDAEADIDRLFLTSMTPPGGSPVLIFNTPIITPTTQHFGNTDYRAQVVVSLQMRCKVWQDESSRELNVSQTRLQWLKAKDVLLQLLRYRMGIVPIYDSDGPEPPSATLVGKVRFSPMMSMIDREDGFTTDVTLRGDMEVHAEIVCS